MDQRPELTAPQREEAARRFLQEVRTRGRFTQFQPLLRSLPLLLHQHGLGQTLAYLQSRGAGRAESPYQMLYDQLGDWLYTWLGLSSGDALAVLTRADSRVYAMASEEVEAFALALRRALAQEQGSSSEAGEGENPREVD